MNNTKGSLHVWAGGELQTTIGGSKFTKLYKHISGLPSPGTFHHPTTKVDNLNWYINKVCCCCADGEKW